LTIHQARASDDRSRGNRNNGGGAGEGRCISAIFETRRCCGAEQPAIFGLDAYGIPGGALGLEIRHFADVIRGRADPAISMNDAIKALRLSLAMEASATTGQPIALTTFGRIGDDSLNEAAIPVSPERGELL